MASPELARSRGDYFFRERDQAVRRAGEIKDRVYLAYNGEVHIFDPGFRRRHKKAAAQRPPKP